MKYLPDDKIIYIGILFVIGIMKFSIILRFDFKTSKNSEGKVTVGPYIEFRLYTIND